MADTLTKLLLYIVEHPLMQNEIRESQLDATAVTNVQNDIRGIADDRKADANRLSDAFATGLRRAASEGGSVTVRDTDPEGNLIADALARFLVATKLASSSTTTVSEGHYEYTFTPDWQALRDLGQRAGINLDEALSGRQ